MCLSNLSGFGEELLQGGKGAEKLGRDTKFRVNLNRALRRAFREDDSGPKTVIFVHFGALRVSILVLATQKEHP